MRSRPKIDHPVISKEEGNIFQAKRDPFLLQAKYLVKQKKETSSLSICKRGRRSDSMGQTVHCNYIFIYCNISTRNPLLSWALRLVCRLF